MIIQRKIRFLKPALAARPPINPSTPGARREFDREVQGDLRTPILANMQRWEWAFLEARDSLKIPRNRSIACIMPATSFAAKTSTYTRSYRRGTDGAPQSELFECIPSNSSIVWEWALARELPPHVEIIDDKATAPDEDEFDSMLAYIGRMLGMSEWGNHYGFGRFTIDKR